MYTLYISVLVLLSITLKCVYLRKYSNSMNKEIQSGEKQKGCAIIESWQIGAFSLWGVFTNLRKFATLNMC